MNTRAAAAAMIALLTAGLARAEERGLIVKPRAQWQPGQLAVEVSFDLDPMTDSLPRAKWNAETEIESRRGDFLVEAVSALAVDSSRTFGDMLAGDPSLFQSIRGRALEAPRVALFLSPDFRRLIARYLVPFFGETGIASAVAHGEQSPIRRRLGYAASRTFTGILISARGKLPAGGSSAEAALVPALFPRIFDQEMDLVLDRSMVSPETISHWGMVGYASSLEDSVVTTRAGLDPLRIAARAVFGKNPTDIVISEEAARQILTVPENIELLRQGKIVVVCEGLE
jgi:hypothetical protein